MHRKAKLSVDRWDSPPSCSIINHKSNISFGTALNFLMSHRSLWLLLSMLYLFLNLLILFQNFVTEKIFTKKNYRGTGDSD